MPWKDEVNWLLWGKGLDAQELGETGLMSWVLIAVVFWIGIAILHWITT